jgi:dynein heavy chain
MTDAMTVRTWALEGLPSDWVSVDNGILVTRGKRWPLIIDPQTQGNKWIKKHEEKNGLQLLKLTEPNVMRVMENCIRLGKALLLEDIAEEVDPSLEPILMKQTFKKGNQLLIRLGETDVDYDPNFKLYITTKLPNPHYLPELSIKVTLINFTVTQQGLEDQLLGDVVRKERPEIEHKKDQLVLSMAADRKQLADLEDRVLKLLSTSEGNLLDDEVLISTLQDSKVTSENINKRVVEAEQTEKDINAAREQYRSVATRGSLMYFIIADLANIDPMYQYSLSYITRMFNHCLSIAPKAPKLEDRLKHLIDVITEFIFTNVCRGLFEKDKMIFSFLLSTQFLRHSKDISVLEWNFLTRGPSSEPEQTVKNPDASIISAEQWRQLLFASQSIKAMAGLAEAIHSQFKDWQVWIQHAEPHAAALPMSEPSSKDEQKQSWDMKLTPFQKMLLLKTFRKEKLLFAFEAFVSKTMGSNFVEPPPFKLDDVFKDSSCRTPIIFILSTGADPTSILLRFCESMEMTQRLQMISLGQGQGPVAARLIKQGQDKGEWICLQNCHLATSWMHSLEVIVDDFSDTGNVDPHEDFRLWLTSMPSKTFPVPVLQNGIKLTNEPPKGLRVNMMRSFAAFNETFFEGEQPQIPNKRMAWQKLVFGIAFFHAVVQERRKFGPLGWNIRYDFNQSDLEIALATLRMFLAEQAEIPWAALVYVTGEINYGGRVTDDLDRRLLMTMLEKYYTPKALKDSYTYSGSGVYRPPPASAENSLKLNCDFIAALPQVEEPEVFGMHENANMTFQMQEVDKILDTILAMQPRVAGSGAGKSSDEIVAEMANNIEEHLPAQLNVAEAGSHTFKKGEGGQLNSLATVLSQEIVRFNRLLKRMASTLADLQRAIKGLVVMSAELEGMFDSILSNRQPELWIAVGYPSLKPLASWVKDFHSRMEFMRKWLLHGEPKCFALPYFFFPQGFMTGVLQNHARRYRAPIDALSFRFHMMKFDTADDVTNAPIDGVYISGLFMEGGRWDKKKAGLADSAIGELFSPVPVLHFIPAENVVTNADDYDCPLYKTNVRAGVLSTTGQSTNFILCVSLPTKKPANYWVLQGTALVTMVND